MRGKDAIIISRLKGRGTLSAKVMAGKEIEASKT